MLNVEQSHSVLVSYTSSSKLYIIFKYDQSGRSRTLCLTSSFYPSLQSIRGNTYWELTAGHIHVFLFKMRLEHMYIITPQIFYIHEELSQVRRLLTPLTLQKYWIFVVCIQFYKY